ncbi:MAG: lipopolysaccharide heptosyltransferase II [Deltaproteobacteria bacterium HGW-Deltaproteobacteria-13]|nr:MAG: lipopolysaccharide heptosyltransferase II [Deltaproteobacteria bacterium HGW-Deltaproteobacteria-13]
MNILIVKLSAIGDVIHTLPSLAALRRLYPDAHITWVIEEAAADLIKNHPHLDEVLVSGRKRWNKDFRGGQLRRPLREFRSFLKTLRQRPYDLVIDFHGLFKSSIIVLLSRGKRKLGYDSMQELSGLFLNEKIPEDMNKHAVDRYLDFPRYLGAKIDNAQFVLPSHEEAEVKVQNLLRKYNLEDKKFIAINPVALWETKLWNNEKFARLADLIHDQLQMKVVFTGNEKKSIEDITSFMTTEKINLGGETSLPELACLYKKTQLVISTDSGPMHLAAAVGTPVIALFGPTDPARTGPYGPGHRVIRTQLPCSPCFLKKCPTKKCMEDISAGQVFATVEKMIKGGRNADK